MSDPFGTPYTEDVIDIQYMQVSIVEANKSIPAPQAYCVGAALVNAQGELLTTGFSRELPGNTHAEECCLLKMDSAVDLTGATMYTTMEPCSFRLSGNRSCTSRILESNIKRVVIGVREPPNLVNCEGIQLLQKEGVQVYIVPNVQEACLAPNKHILNKD
jgi:pyrimidine deaminase RibD-like protein